MKKKLVITIICTNIFITAIAQENKVTIEHNTKPANTRLNFIADFKDGSQRSFH